MSPTSQFSYEKLRHSTSLRLVDLLPGKRSDKLVCRMYSSNLDRDPRYEAVSYVWGSEANKIQILCNGAEFAVTRNLAAALLRFRRKDRKRTLWIDAICIDQDNIPERNQQVGIMGRVYRKASHVLVWLGEEEFMRDAMEGLNMLYDRVADHIEELQQFDRTVSRTDEQRAEALAMLNLPPADSLAFQAICKLFQSAWFTRAWTFQESYLAEAKTYYFGKYRVTDTTLSGTFIMIYHLTWVGYGDRTLSFDRDKVLGMLWRENMFSVDDVAIAKHSNRWALLESRRGAGCKNPSDLLYSLIGIPSVEVNIIPDYAKPYTRVYVEFAYSIMQDMGNLNVLRTAGENLSESPCPSWVPDWMYPHQSADPTGFSSNSNSHYSCTGSSRPLIQLSENWHDLELQAVRCDRISVLCEFDALDTAVTQALEAKDHELSRSLPDLPGGFPCTNFRLLCADLALYDDDKDNHLRWSYVAFFQFFTDVVAEEENGNETKKMRFVYRYSQNTLANNIMLTADSRLGLAPKNARPGDIIVLPLGGEVPIVLRSKGDKFSLVGECFVLDMMDGEGLIEARLRAQPDWDRSDVSWLHRLHEETLPFETEKFVIC